MNEQEIKEVMEMLRTAGVRPMLCTQCVPVSTQAAKCGPLTEVFDETIDVPPTATHFVFGVNSYYGTTIYVDDCWVIDVSEHFTTGIKPISL